MAGFHSIETIRAQVINTDYKISILGTSETIQFNSRLINISAGSLELIIKPAPINNSLGANTIKIDPEDTTIRALLEVETETFSLLRQSLHSQKKLNAVIHLKLETSLTLSDQGDLIINGPIEAQILDCEFTRNFI